jgi:hypothetical protein
MFRVAFVLMLVGLINGWVGAAITYHLNSHLPTDLDDFQTWVRIIDWIWPSALVMAPGGSIVALALSVVANGCLYGVVGLVIGAIWEMLAAAMR